MKRITLIHNPRAGDENHSRDHLLGLLRDAGYDPVYKSSKEDVAEALEDPGDLVVVAGGDGTVRRVVMQVLGREVPVAILPMGTANNISTSLGIEGRPEELIASWHRAKRKKFKVGAAKSSWGKERFVEGIGLGLLSRAMSIIDTVDEKTDVDFSTTEDKVYRDLTALIVLVSEYTPVKTKVTVDGQEISGPFLLLEIMNIGLVGPNLMLAPQAQPGDDHLDCVFLAESNRENFAKYLTKLMAGKQAVAPVDVVKGQQIQFDWEGAPIHLDDKIWTKGITVPPPPQIIDVELDDSWIEYLAPD